MASDSNESAQKVIEVFDNGEFISGTNSTPTASTTGRRCKRKTTAWVFDHFYGDGDISGRFCAVEGCGRSFSMGTSTTILAYHLTKSHLIKGSAVPGQVGQLTVSNNGARLIAHNRLDDDKRTRLFSKLVDCIVESKQASAVVENACFKKMMKAANPFVTVPSRRTIGRGVNDGYDEAKAKLLLLVKSIPGDIALTCDGWFSRIMRGYFVVTLHWIDEVWKLRSTVIEFTYFPPPHDQWTTSELLLSILKALNLATRVRAITTDSGGEMLPALRHMAEKLNDEFDTKLESHWHVRCVCHIINRAVKYCEAIVKLVFEKIRTLLKTIRVSVALREAFRDVQVLLGKANIVNVPNLDVETRRQKV